MYGGKVLGGVSTDLG